MCPTSSQCRNRTGRRWQDRPSSSQTPATWPWDWNPAPGGYCTAGATSGDWMPTGRLSVIYSIASCKPNAGRTYSTSSCSSSRGSQYNIVISSASVYTAELLSWRRRPSSVLPSVLKLRLHAAWIQTEFYWKLPVHQISKTIFSSAKQNSWNQN